MSIVKRTYFLSIHEGLDTTAVLPRWTERLSFLTKARDPPLRISASPTNRSEVQLDWNAPLPVITQYTNILREMPEYGGSTSILDPFEQDRMASSLLLQRMYSERSEQQRQEESAESLKNLQPSSSSQTGIFRAAELGDVVTLRSMIHGLPLPVYDRGKGNMVPDPSSVAAPCEKHVLHARGQLAHSSDRGRSMRGAEVEDIQLAAPHLFSGVDEERTLRIESSFDLKNADGQTPLHLAAASGKVAAVEYLIEHDANVNATNRLFQTPLHMAAMEGRREVVVSLLRHQANALLAAGDGRTMMHFAARRCRADFVEWLLFSPEGRQHKLSELLLLTTKEHETVFHMAASNDSSSSSQQDRTNVVKLMVRAITALCCQDPLPLLRLPDSRGFSVLHVCAQHDNYEIIRFVSSLRIDVNSTCGSGNSPLHVAVRMKHEKSVHVLLLAGCRVSLSNSEGDTPLHLAASTGLLSIFKSCFQASPPPPQPPVIKMLNHAGDAPLHIACRLCQQDEEEESVDGGVEGEDKGEEGRKEMEKRGQAKAETKKENSYHEIIQFAVLHRADPLQRNEQGEDAMMCAMRGGNERTVGFLAKSTWDEGRNVSRALLNRNQQGESALHAMARYNHAHLLGALLSWGGDLGSKSCSRTGVVTEAVMSRSKEVLVALLEHGADAMEVDLFLRTPLHWAAKIGSTELCEVLLEHGAEVDKRDRAGNNPALLAAKEEKFEAVELLLRYHADPRLEDREKKSLLELETSSTIAKLLEEMQTWRVAPTRVYRTAEISMAEEEASRAVEQVLEICFLDYEEGGGEEEKEEEKLSVTSEMLELQEESASASILTDPPSFRPPTAYVEGAHDSELVALSWLRPKTTSRPLPAARYPPLRVSFRPNTSAMASTGAMEGSSALDQQMWVVEQEEALPPLAGRRRMERRAKTASEAFLELHSTHGAMRAVDVAGGEGVNSWAWLDENRPVTSLSRSRALAKDLRRLEGTLRRREEGAERRIVLPKLPGASLTGPRRIERAKTARAKQGDQSARAGREEEEEEELLLEQLVTRWWQDDTKGKDVPPDWVKFVDDLPPSRHAKRVRKHLYERERAAQLMEIIRQEEGR